MYILSSTYIHEHLYPEMYISKDVYNYTQIYISTDVYNYTQRFIYPQTHISIPKDSYIHDVYNQKCVNSADIYISGKQNSEECFT